MFKPVSSKLSFPQMEEEVLRFWQENDTFKKSIANRQEIGRASCRERV